jgi:hypothetical protein
MDWRRRVRRVRARTSIPGVKTSMSRLLARFNDGSHLGVHPRTVRPDAAQLPFAALGRHHLPRRARQKPDPEAVSGLRVIRPSAACGTPSCVAVRPRTIKGSCGLIAKRTFPLGLTDVKDQVFVRTSRLRKHATKLPEFLSHGAQHAPHDRSPPPLRHGSACHRRPEIRRSITTIDG